MGDAAGAAGRAVPRARGQVLKAVAKTWPGFIAGAVEGRARELIDEDRYDEAAAVLRESVERYGPESVSTLLFAWTLHLAGAQEEALEWADRAIADDPEDTDAWWIRAMALHELGRRDEAAGAMGSAVELAPGNARYRMQLVWMRHEDQEFATTREQVERAVALAPDDAWIQATAGRVYDHHLRHRLAHRHYLLALELEPGDADVRGDLAEILTTRGRLSEAVAAAWETTRLHGLSEADAAEAAEMYDVTLRRWSWRWYEWVLRLVLLLNVIDWIFPTPMPGSAVVAGALVCATAVLWGRSLSRMPRECRRDLVAKGRRGHFAGALARMALVLAGAAAMAVAEPTGLQHLGILGLLIAAYAEWYWRAARISGRRLIGEDAADTAPRN